MKIRHFIIGIIIVIIIVFTNIIYRNLFTTKDTTIRTYTNNSIEYLKKRTKKSKKKVKKTKKKATKKKTSTAFKPTTASRETYYQYAQNYSHYDSSQMNCLINLWQRESGWNARAKNKKSGACGIPQALPCKKIKSQKGSYNWDAQIRWGVDHINWVYKTPCNAWNHFRKYGWY